MPTPRDLDLLFELGSLRNMPRGWRQHLGMDCASILEHTMRVAFLALIIARREGQGDEAKILKMALVHDLTETRVSDLSYVQKVYVTADEAKAANEMLAGTSVADIADVIATYERRETIEAKIVKDADNLDIDIELREVENLGHLLPAKWRTLRRKVRDEKLYTQTAKQLWDEIQTADPDAWHILTNKWLRIPSAGR